MLDQVFEAVSPQEEPEDTMRDKHLIFLLDKQEYAIEIRYVLDIINIQPVTRMPACPDYVCGITNLRGKVIPVIDLRVRFGKTPIALTDRTCIIVTELDGIAVGMLTDKVCEVLAITKSQISPPPEFSVDTNYISGIAKTPGGVKLVLDYKMVVDQAGVSENA